MRDHLKADKRSARRAIAGCLLALVATVSVTHGHSTDPVGNGPLQLGFESQR